MKYIVVANDICHVKQLNNIGVSNIVASSKYSSYRNAFSINDIKDALEITKSLYVSFYDLISESIIDEVTAYIDELITIGVRNFIVNDLGIVQYLKSFNVNVIYDNITLNTSSATLNVLATSGIDSAVLGREITLDEINEIADNCNMDVIVHAQGMFPIFTSIRKLISNYEKAKDVDANDNYVLYQKDRNAKYPIIENSNGVVMFSSYEQCSIEDIDNLRVNTLLIDQPFVANEDSIKIVKMYLDDDNYKISDIESIIKHKQSRGFFYKKTMYKL